LGSFDLLVSYFVAKEKAARKAAFSFATKPPQKANQPTQWAYPRNPLNPFNLWSF
jgi:hypothetical protein